MPADELSFSEFVELMLARTAEADRAEPGAYVDMFPLAKDLKQDVPDMWVYDARDALAARSWVNPLKVFGRTAPAKLTGEGRLFVEQGGSTGVIDEYRRHPSNFVWVSGMGNRVAVGVSGDVQQNANAANTRADYDRLISEIETDINESSEIDSDRRRLALEDLDAARNQLHRPSPNWQAVSALLHGLSDLSFVRARLTEIRDMIG